MSHEQMGLQFFDLPVCLLPSPGLLQQKYPPVSGGVSFAEEFRKKRLASWDDAAIDDGTVVLRGVVWPVQGNRLCPRAGHGHNYAQPAKKQALGRAGDN
jgi:hypothetical protein